MAGLNFEDLLSTGAHFGHVTRKWHPRFKPYILMEKNGIHIINLEETIEQFAKAANFIKTVVDRGGEVLFVGTKKQAQEIVQQEADRCGMFYVVERWLGGTLTNFMTIKKSIKRLQLLEKEGSGVYESLTKKEIQMLNRERIKLADQHRGIKDMRRLPDALIIVDTDYESTAVAEAHRLEIPVVGLLDSNTDPTLVDYPIPANDDSIRTIQLIISSIAEVIIESKKAKIQSEARPVEKKTEIGSPVPEAVTVAIDISGESETAPEVAKALDSAVEKVEPVIAKVEEKSEPVIAKAEEKSEPAAAKAEAVVKKKPVKTISAKTKKTPVKPKLIVDADGDEKEPVEFDTEDPKE
ncbi:MAG: 30S ribosomal protein S2 [Candidatus Neomarinimicrobiota bacterium]